MADLAHALIRLRIRDTGAATTAAPFFVANQGLAGHV